MLSLCHTQKSIQNGLKTNAKSWQLCFGANSASKGIKGNNNNNNNNKNNNHPEIVMIYL